MIDIALAKYKHDKQIAPDFRAPDGNPVLQKQAIVRSAIRNRVFDELVKRMRDGAHLCHEGHTKQVQFLLDRERYLQNQTWQAEYDRLASFVVAPRLQPSVNARLDDLKTLLIK
jgi:hypothetical protein